MNTGANQLQKLSALAPLGCAPEDMVDVERALAAMRIEASELPTTGVHLQMPAKGGSPLPLPALATPPKFPAAAIEGHLLLGGSDLLNSSTEEMLLALQGGGSKSTRMLDLSDSAELDYWVRLFHDDRSVQKLLRNMRHIDRTPSDIGARVVICVHILGRQARTHDWRPELVRAVRRHLSETLLAHPVLLHPSILIPVDSRSSVGYMNLYHALAMLRAGLPRLSHFIDEVDASGGPTGVVKAGAHGDTNARTQIIDRLHGRLRAFATHPCVRAALHKPTTRINYTSVARAPARVTSEHLSGMGCDASAEFFGAVMELQELAGDELTLPRLSNPLRQTLDQQQVEAFVVQDILAKSLLAGCGMRRAASSLSGSYPAPVSPADTGLMDSLRKRQHLMEDKNLLCKRIEPALFRGMFPDAFSELRSQDVSDNMRALAAGLVRAGAAQSPGAAGAIILNTVLGQTTEWHPVLERMVPVTNLLESPVEQAAAFLQAIGELSGFDASAMAQLHQVRAVVAELAAERAANSGPWLTALDITLRSRLMSDVIAQRTAEAQAEAQARVKAGSGAGPAVGAGAGAGAEGAAEAVVAEPGPVRRRSRMSV